MFQYFAIAPMRGLSFRKGLMEATKADVLSLTCFEVGLFGWMALMAFVFFPAAFASVAALRKRLVHFFEAVLCALEV